ncbi:DNA-binding protein [Chondrinema litorale]|uniref:DNA-binding protein n=1 Tax=Chondrinema litorale TaxID=2994555 RepID=UPI0025433BDE|nr:DNA-binding protein [Chondrinema litorale]UZR98678.1 DNA-binding protein [Chondrinema litorale]
MNITFNKLREIKHSLPHGSISKIAHDLEIDEQYVRNYFGGTDIHSGNDIAGIHKQPGPDGGIVNIDDTTILEKAQQILRESQLV